jgi:MFS family permease
MSTSISFKVLNELGLVSLWISSLDTKLLCAQRFFRLFAYGSSTLILVSYLSALDISKTKIGVFMTLTLIGDTVLSFIFTIFADALGRKAILLLGAVLMIAAGAIFALFGNYWVLLVAAVIGVISPKYVYNSPSISTSCITFLINPRGAFTSPRETYVYAPWVERTWRLRMGGFIGRLDLANTLPVVTRLGPSAQSKNRQLPK